MRQTTRDEWEEHISRLALWLAAAAGGPVPVEINLEAIEERAEDDDE